jgi:hypothetical protein
MIIFTLFLNKPFLDDVSKVSKGGVLNSIVEVDDCGYDRRDNDLNEPPGSNIFWIRSTGAHHLDNNI